MSLGLWYSRSSNRPGRSRFFKDVKCGNAWIHVWPTRQPEEFPRQKLARRDGHLGNQMIMLLVDRGSAFLSGKPCFLGHPVNMACRLIRLALILAVSPLRRDGKVWREIGLPWNVAGPSNLSFETQAHNGSVSVSFFLFSNVYHPRTLHRRGRGTLVDTANSFL